MEAAAARPGYEIWRPNRQKADAKTTKVVIAFVLLISAALLAVITLGGWERLESSTVGIVSLVWAGLYVLFAFMVIRWSRGVLAVASALAVILAIFAAVAAPGWFARAKDGLSSPALPEELLGLLTVVLIPVQLLLVAVAMVGFNQDWHVEEERPVGGEEHGDAEPAPPYGSEPVEADDPGGPAEYPEDYGEEPPAARDDPGTEPGPPPPRGRA